MAAGSQWAINTISGTSMAAPHVSGVAAMLLAKQGPTTPAAMKKQILETASDNLISSVRSGTPNKLLHKARPY